jgi:hypothetical protein
MKIRKILPGNRVPTGFFYSMKNGGHVDYESPVERDYYQTLEFEDEIERYEAQSVKVPNPRKPGSPYYPDCVVYYKPYTGRKPLLVEVKSEKDLRDPKKAPLLELKFATCEEYAAANGMDFKVVLDTDIRGQRLDNLDFLYGYREPPKLFGSYKDQILINLDGKGASVSEILDTIAKDRLERAWILPSVWHLVWTKVLVTDLNKPITNSSILKVKI